MIGVADRRHHGEGDGGDHRRDVADPEQHHHRDDEAEGRQRLQRVDDRRDDLVERSLRAADQAPIGNADQAGDEGRDAAEIDRRHRLFPQAGDGAEGGQQRDQQRQAQAAELIAGKAEQEHARRARAAPSQKARTGFSTLRISATRNASIDVEEVDRDPVDRRLPDRRGGEGDRLRHAREGRDEQAEQRGDGEDGDRQQQMR